MRLLFEKAVLAVAVLAAFGAAAFEEIPKESAKALRVTRGRAFSAGLVFVNGKYIDPPYQVERWGTGIRINSIPVTGQVINWTEFVKTQDSATAVKQEAPESAPPPPPPPAAPAKSDVDALDDLFDDDPKPQKKTSQSGYSSAPANRPAAQPKPRSPAATYTFDGPFVKNDASKALVKRINDLRTEIDGILRKGGFIFFGDEYSRVTGDARTADTMLAALPELMQNSHDVHEFRAGIRSAHMVYINEILSGQLFGNRVDYRRLKERRQQIKSDREWEALLKEAKRPLL